MTLTFKLVRDIMKVNVYANFQVRTSNCSAARAQTDRHTHTDTQTHRRIHGINNITANVDLCNRHTSQYDGPVLSAGVIYRCDSQTHHDQKLFHQGKYKENAAEKAARRNHLQMSHYTMKVPSETCHQFMIYMI